jgi:hypothetical protein
LPLSSRFFFFRIPFIPPPSLHPTAIGMKLTLESCARRNRIDQVLRLAVLDSPALHVGRCSSVRSNQYRYSYLIVHRAVIDSCDHTRRCAPASRTGSLGSLKTKLSAPHLPKCFISSSYKNSSR